MNSSQAFPPERGQLQVGASTHTLEAALSAQSAGADYVFLGPIFHPNSKTTSSILGTEAFAAISAVLEVPVFALGGITVSNASAAISAGADGVAGIGLFADPERIQETILGLRREMESGREGASKRNGRN